MIARVLDGLRVDVTIVGTRTRPRLDFSKVNIPQLLLRAQQLLFAEEAERQLERILRPKKPQPETQPTTKPTTRPAGERLEETILDLLLDLLDNQKDKDNPDQLPGRSSESCRSAWSSSSASRGRSSAAGQDSYSSRSTCGDSACADCVRTTPWR